MPDSLYERHHRSGIHDVVRENGGALRALMERWHGDPALDANFEAEVFAAEDSTSAEQNADPCSPATTAERVR